MNTIALDSPTTDMASDSASSANHRKHLPETSSRFLTDTITVSHNFEVTGYSLIDSMGFGWSISSSTFSAGGYDWNIEFYPDGYSEEEAGYASAYLKLSRGEPAVRVKYTLGILDMDGNQLIRNNASITHTFDLADDYSWGYPKFFIKTGMDAMAPFDGDCFTIRCVLMIFTPRTLDLSNVVVPQSNIQNHLLGMLKDGKGTDVAFSVGDQLFHTHRYMLAARSPVFRAELFNEMKETDAHCIRIDDMEPSTFAALLHFVYTDSDNILDKCGPDEDVSFQQLFVAADRYGLDRLRAMCELKLCQSIDVHTVAATLALAEQHHCVQLKNTCLGFMSSHGVLSAILETDGFKHLKSSCPSILEEIIDKVAKCMSFK